MLPHETFCVTLRNVRQNRALTTGPPPFKLGPVGSGFSCPGSGVARGGTMRRLFLLLTAVWRALSDSASGSVQCRLRATPAFFSFQALPPASSVMSSPAGQPDGHRVRVSCLLRPEPDLSRLRLQPRHRRLPAERPPANAAEAGGQRRRRLALVRPWRCPPTGRTMHLRL